MPDRIAKLPVRRGYPVPWFVAMIDGDYDFRVMDERKKYMAISRHQCWVCGEPLGAWVTFAIGPMCAVNRVSAEPPSHRDCAEWSACACPFLSRPHARRRPVDREQTGTKEPPGVMLERNPGVTLLWHTTRERFRYNPRTQLFQVGDPYECSWFCEGRTATRDEILASITSGLPALRQIAEEQGPNAVRVLEKYVQRALKLVPAA